MNSPDMAKRFLDTGALETLRATADWRAICQALGLERDEKRSRPDDWWMRSPFSEDKTASFHIKPADGVWYCFSTRQGGGVIELIQRLEGLNCFEAGEWMFRKGDPADTFYLIRQGRVRLTTNLVHDDNVPHVTIEK